MKKIFSLENFTPTPKISGNKADYGENLVKGKSEFWCEGLIYTIIFLLPIYLVKLSIFGLPTNALETLIAVAFIWALSAKISPKGLLKPSFRAAIGLVFVGLFISTLINKNYTLGFGIIKGWFILPLLFAVIAQKVVPKEKRENLYLALYFSAVAVALIGIFYLISGMLTFDGRLQAFFNSPNYLAMYLSPAIIIGLTLAQNQKSKIKNQNNNTKFKSISWWVSFAIILIAFYFTYSYAAWAAVAASLILAEIIKNKQAKTAQIKEKSLSNLCICTNLIDFFKIKIIFKKHIKIILPIVILGATFFIQNGENKFQDLKNVSERSSFQSRIMVWKSAGKVLVDNWLWGIGPGNFQEKYLEYQKYFPPYLEWAVPHPHNIFLDFWLSSGVIGLVGFIGLVIFWFRQTLKTSDNMKYIALGIMLYILIHGLADTTYFKNDLAVVFWLNFLAIL